MGETVLQSVPTLRWIPFPVCISWQKLKGDLLKAIITSCNLLFFCWLSFYIIWIPISVLKLLYVSRIIPNQITENINIHWYWYLYRNCLDTFPSDGRKWIQKERKNWGSSIHLQDFHLFGEHYEEILKVSTQPDGK